MINEPLISGEIYNKSSQLIPILFNEDSDSKSMASVSSSASTVSSVSSKMSKEKKSRKKIIWKIIKTYESHLDNEIEEN